MLTPFVVKKGSKIRLSVSGSIPVPLSSIETATNSPCAAAWPRTAGTRSTFRATILSFPPNGIASRALITMFRIAVSN